MATKTIAAFIALISISAIYFKPQITKYTSDILSSTQCQKIRPCKVLGEFLSLEENENRDRLLTGEELKRYRGENGQKLYLSILGKVYDVTRGAKFYGPGEGYHGFTGTDASRAFITGDFTEEGLTDDVSGLDKKDFLGLRDWVLFYEKEYPYIGKLIGRYYDANGRPTEHLREVNERFAEAQAAEYDKETLKQKFPPCNVEYKPETGSRVWCTKASGGVQRDWIGFPRSLYAPNENDVRCACVNEDDLDDPLVKEYPGCPKDSHSCKLPQ